MPRLRRRALAAAAVTVALVAGGGAAIAATQQPAIHTITPKTAGSITNIDVLRQQIKNYYGDPLGTGAIGTHSNYVKEVHRIEAHAGEYLAKQRHIVAAKKALIFDVDDTTLANYEYEVASNWAYNPTTNAAYVTDQKFPAVPGMVRLVNAAKAGGYKVFFITGRPAAQEASTLGNLTSDGIGIDAGYSAPSNPKGPDDGLFTKPAVADYPDYLQAACADDPNGACTTIHYKSATRKHLESLGYDIVADFGDQYSDLKGGATGRTFKLPNPSYYLP